MMDARAQSVRREVASSSHSQANLQGNSDKEIN
jgi:hypothetical protein